MVMPVGPAQVQVPIAVPAPAPAPVPVPVVPAPVVAPAPVAPILPPTPPMVPPAAPPIIPPAPPQPPPATVAPDGTLAHRPPADKITNPFERTATMILDTAEAWAERLADNLGEHPADHAPVDNATVHEMFHFSPYGLDAPMRFWALHDQLLQTAMAANDPDPAAVAERGALEEVYPYRAQLALLDSLGPAQRVARAQELLDISHRQIAKGNPHTALPTIVGPAGLPPSDTPKRGY